MSKYSVKRPYTVLVCVVLIIVLGAASIYRMKMDLLPDMSRTVYVYGSTEQESCAAAQKLSDMGYTGISEIGAYGDWITAQSETESLMEGLLD